MSLKCPEPGCPENYFTGMIVIDGQSLCARGHIHDFSCKTCEYWSKWMAQFAYGCLNSNWSGSRTGPDNPVCTGMTYERREDNNA